MTIHDRIIAGLEDCPTARELVALAHAERNDGPTVAVRVSLAADILVRNHPELAGCNIQIARILADGIYAMPAPHDPVLN